MKIQFSNCVQHSKEEGSEGKLIAELKKVQIQFSRSTTFLSLSPLAQQPFSEKAKCENENSSREKNLNKIDLVWCLSLCAEVRIGKELGE